MHLNIQDLNKEIKSCTRCRLSETRKQSLVGEGNLHARIMIIAQAPGEKEDETGRMFVGPSGKVLDKLLTSANVKREEVYMTNLVKCMLPRYRRPKQDEIEKCSSYLDREIELINPRALVPLGRYATTYVFKKYGIKLSTSEEFYKVYGKLFFSGDKKILPLQHPAALIYNPELEEVMLRNYHKLSVLSTECKWYEVCPMKRFYDAGRLNKKWVELYCRGDWESCRRYQLEERGIPHPDNMLPDGSIDELL
ncbi:MAG: uracil-DNA glycosylase [Thermoplasmata archaeon]|nr:MAG: uracil-DNA glycosylase [Thermoplasmata archaeon]